jgi:formylglycine-generating enzyme required for sulfatase activity
MSHLEQKQALKRVALSVREALVVSVPTASVPETSSAASAAPPQTSPPAGGETVRESSGRSGDSPWPLHPIRATSCQLLREGNRWRQLRTPVEVEGYEEELAPGVALTMVRIPAGHFLMGSPDGEAERSNDEGPQHEVSVREFFLGQTPITQAQWQVVAGWQKIAADLNPDPAHFKGAKRPLETVSWIEAVEFCRRLSARTGRSYSLPSEAQWEYACRAGTTTPFHFGSTITVELANYDGNFSYGDGLKGTYRGQTTDVGTFPANPWGLQDMHGNVGEWCADHFHENYDFAPGDDQPWLIPAAGPEEFRLLRGGSWVYNPWYCRSAFRYRLAPDFRDLIIGFRVCCLPPGLPSQP